MWPGFSISRTSLGHKVNSWKNPWWSTMLKEKWERKNRLVVSTLWKNISQSVGIIIPNIWKNKTVPNHQPENYDKPRDGWSGGLWFFPSNFRTKPMSGFTTGVAWRGEYPPVKHGWQWKNETNDRGTTWWRNETMMINHGVIPTAWDNVQSVQAFPNPVEKPWFLMIFCASWRNLRLSGDFFPYQNLSDWKNHSCKKSSVPFPGWGDPE